ncbi:MAG TPA: tryptophan 2,3-dioxygenase family protein [Cyclobacteriaceae bacterium]|nr:tryptophan 2,3-dioxygenase family protein [Cyclobacteriaceae bacterium]
MDSSLDPRLQQLLQKLQQKYAVMGQDLSSYLDGLLHADYLTYWDYIHLDTLLSLQNPKTQFPDEKIFITYHQITELYFNLVLWEMEQIAAKDPLDKTFFVARMKRIIRYFQNLCDSFDTMTDGMEREQFLKFRMSLLPASGFQSAQYRLIEICSTDLINLVDAQFREEMREYSDIGQQVDKLYWRSGATELASGKKTLTLQQFEDKYMKQFRDTAMAHREKNLRKLYMKNFSTDPEVIDCLRKYDELANVLWPLAHMRSAARYLQKDPEDIKATGGTNWQKYLPPRFQKIFFFPELWSEKERAEWGRAGIERALTAKSS